MQWEFAMDAGSENMRFATGKRVDAFHESSCVAVRASRGVPFAWGDRARAYLGRERADMQIVRPATGGIVTDAALLGMWGEKLLNAAPARALKRAGLLLGVSPLSLTDYSRRAQKSLIDAGADAVGLVRTDVASAIGAGLDVMSPAGCFIVDAGAETITASLISYGRVARSETLPMGMSRIDEWLKSALSEQMGCAFGPITLREIKHELAYASGASGRVTTSKPGFDFGSMMPRMREVRAEWVMPSTEGVVREICALCARLTLNLPEELAADVMKCGITLTGGGANLFGLDARLSDATGLSVSPAPDCEYCAILGLHQIMTQPVKYAPLIEDVMEGVRKP